MPEAPLRYADRGGRFFLTRAARFHDFARTLGKTERRRRVVHSFAAPRDMRWMPIL
jgi:hypothetical protein